MPLTSDNILQITATRLAMSLKREKDMLALLQRANESFDQVIAQRDYFKARAEGQSERADSWESAHNNLKEAYDILKARKEN